MPRNQLVPHRLQLLLHLDISSRLKFKFATLLLPRNSEATDHHTDVISALRACSAVAVNHSDHRLQCYNDISMGISCL